MSIEREPKAVVLGRYSDNSGTSDVVYGPYAKTRAEQVAEDLNAGEWKSMRWEAVPVGQLPGERPPGPATRAAGGAVAAMFSPESS